MTQFRADEGLAFMLQYENVAWYDAGEVRILDRRIYPAKIEFVRCKTHVEVMQAIRDMVTQSAGPYTAAAMGMALAAYECREKPAEEQLRFLQAADETISNARPTTYKRMKLVCDGCLEAAKLALREARPVDLAIREHAVNANNRRYSKVNEIAKYLVPLIPDGGTVMTQCFGETIVGMMLKEAKQSGKTFRLRGHGIRSVRNAEKGDLYVHTTVEIPVNMTTEQKDILRQFDASINHSKKDHHAPERKSFFEKLGKLFK